MELIAYLVKKPDDPIDISRLRRDRADAWRLFLDTDEPNIEALQRQARVACGMQGVRCCCLQVVQSGYGSDL